MIESWLQDLVGAAYTPRGRAPEEGFDCYGLLCYVIKQGKGVELPDAHFWGLRHMEMIGSNITEPGMPFLDLLSVGARIQLYDALLLKTGPLAVVDHVGVAVSEEDFLHCGSKIGGVILDRIKNWLPLIPPP